MINETMTGAFATTELVGRKEQLQQILGRIQDSQNTRPCVIFLEGPGGIGKTRLLNEVIEKCKTMPGVKVSEHLIDAYHLLIHTPVEFVEAVFDSLKSVDDTFQEYKRARRVLLNLRLSGEATGIEEQVQEALNAFVIGLKALTSPVEGTSQTRVVIVLDTLERFYYGAAESMLPDLPMAEAWTWLMEQLKSLENIILVTGGRSEARQLLQNLDQSIDVIPISLGKFSLEEAREYFQAAAGAARKNQANHVASVLESLSAAEIEQAYQLTDGRPVMLALVADYVSSGGLLQPLFDEARAAPGKTPQDRFREKILERMLGLEKVGEVLRYMALTIKGMDAEFLRRVLDIPKYRYEQADELLAIIEKFSFVKQRFDPNQEKKIYFLHDEVDDMLVEAAYWGPGHYEEDRQRVYTQVIEYYEEKFKEVRRRLGKAFESLTEGGGGDFNLEELNELYSERTEILLTLLYYRLRQDGPKGYRRWWRYDHEAIVGGDLLFSTQLQLELTAYMRDLDRGKEPRHPDWDDDLVRWSLLLRPVKHAFAREQYQECLQAARRLETLYPEEMKDLCKKAMLLGWKAYALAYTNTPAAHDELEPLERDLEAHVRDLETKRGDVHFWLAKVLLAFVYRVRGYAYQVQEMNNKVIEYYRKAAVLAREADVKVEVATLHNDLGYALMVQGEWSDARALVKNALEIRRELGLGSLVSASVNTLAIIDTYEGMFREGMDGASRALNLARAVKNPRRIGLALIALAEATRRQSMTMSGASLQTRLDLLNRAHDYAEEALQIFQERKETSRQAEALIEMGCARRDAVRLVSELNLTQRYGTEKWIKKSKDALEDAAELAASLVPRRPGPLPPGGCAGQPGLAGLLCGRRRRKYFARGRETGRKTFEVL
jgi:tetratricopeptide (TPR) repeat protein